MLKKLPSNLPRNDDHKIHDIPHISQITSRVKDKSLSQDFEASFNRKNSKKIRFSGFLQKKRDGWWRFRGITIGLITSFLANSVLSPLGKGRSTASTTQLAIIVRRTVYSKGGHSIKNLVRRRMMLLSLRMNNEVGPSLFSSFFFFLGLMGLRGGWPALLWLCSSPGGGVWKVTDIVLGLSGSWRGWWSKNSSFAWVGGGSILGFWTLSQRQLSERRLSKVRVGQQAVTSGRLATGCWLKVVSPIRYIFRRNLDNPTPLESQTKQCCDCKLHVLKTS